MVASLSVLLSRAKYLSALSMKYRYQVQCTNYQIDYQRSNPSLSLKEYYVTAVRNRKLKHTSGFKSKEVFQGRFVFLISRVQNQCIACDSWHHYHFIMDGDVQRTSD